MGFVTYTHRTNRANQRRYITIAALAFAVPIVILTLLLPNKKLGDGHNLVQEAPSPESLEVKKPQT
jgi:hypothetical protein